MTKSHKDYNNYTPELIKELSNLVHGLSHADGVKALIDRLNISDRQARRAYAKYLNKKHIEEVSNKKEEHSVLPNTSVLLNSIESNTFVRNVWFIEPYYTLEVDDDGIRIKSNSKHAKGRELSIYFSADGYPKVKINNTGILVHQLVAHIALGPRPNGLVINHKDGIKTNNHPSNLEYITQKENIHHAIVNGMHVASDPTRMPTYKDGRTMGDKRSAYKKAWYEANRSRISEENRQRYQNKKQ